KAEVILQKALVIVALILRQTFANDLEKVGLAGKNEHTAWGDEHQAGDVFGKLSGIHRRQERSKRMANENKAFLAQDVPNPFDIGDLGADSKSPFKLLQ